MNLKITYKLKPESEIAKPETKGVYTKVHFSYTNALIGAPKQHLYTPIKSVYKRVGQIVRPSLFRQINHEPCVNYC